MSRSANNRKRGGFTLLEIMIVVLVIGVLVSVAIPNWLHARTNGRIKTCISNLKHTEDAKEQFALEHSARDGDAVGWGDLVPAYVKKQPICPAGGNYDLMTIGQDTTCTIPDHVF